MLRLICRKTPKDPCTKTRLPTGANRKCKRSIVWARGRDRGRADVVMNNTTRDQKGTLHPTANGHNRKISVLQSHLSRCRVPPVNRCKREWHWVWHSREPEISQRSIHTNVYGTDMCTPSLHLSCPKWQYAHVARLTLYIICTCAHAALDLSQDTQRSLYQNSTANRCEQKCKRSIVWARGRGRRPTSKTASIERSAMQKSQQSRCRVPLTTNRWQQGKVVGQRKDDWFQIKNGRKTKRRPPHKVHVT